MGTFFEGHEVDRSGFLVLLRHQAADDTRPRSTTPAVPSAADPRRGREAVAGETPEVWTEHLIWNRVGHGEGGDRGGRGPLKKVSPTL